MKPAHILAIGTLLGLTATMLACKRTQPEPVAQTNPPVTLPTPEPVQQALNPMLDGTFSDMKVIRAEGDILGVEVTVSRSQTEPSVTFQCAEGELSKPQYIAATISGTTLHFKTRDTSQCPAAAYTATISNNTMSLTQDGANMRKPQTLKRVAKPGDRPKK